MGSNSIQFKADLKKLDSQLKKLKGKNKSPEVIEELKTLKTGLKDAGLDMFIKKKNGKIADFQLDNKADGKRNGRSFKSGVISSSVEKANSIFKQEDKAPATVNSISNKHFSDASLMQKNGINLIAFDMKNDGIIDLDNLFIIPEKDGPIKPKTKFQAIDLRKLVNLANASIGKKELSKETQNFFTQAGLDIIPSYGNDDKINKVSIDTSPDGDEDPDLAVNLETLEKLIKSTDKIMLSSQAKASYIKEEAAESKLYDATKILSGNKVSIALDNDKKPGLDLDRMWQIPANDSWGSQLDLGNISTEEFAKLKIAANVKEISTSSDNLRSITGFKIPAGMVLNKVDLLGSRFWGETKFNLVQAHEWNLASSGIDSEKIEVTIDKNVFFIDLAANSFKDIDLKNLDSLDKDTNRPKLEIRVPSELTKKLNEKYKGTKNLRFISDPHGTAHKTAVAKYLKNKQ